MQRQVYPVCTISRHWIDGNKWTAAAHLEVIIIIIIDEDDVIIITLPSHTGSVSVALSICISHQVTDVPGPKRMTMTDPGACHCIASIIFHPRATHLRASHAPVMSVVARTMRWPVTAPPPRTMGMTRHRPARRGPPGRRGGGGMPGLTILTILTILPVMAWLAWLARGGRAGGGAGAVGLVGMTVTVTVTVTVTGGFGGSGGSGSGRGGVLVGRDVLPEGLLDVAGGAVAVGEENGVRHGYQCPIPV
jgi:hypothetical protein